MMPMNDCDAVMRQFWDYLDGELNDETMAAIDAHVHECSRCNPHIQFERAFQEALRAAREPVAELTPLRERVRAALAAAGYQAP